MKTVFGCGNAPLLLMSACILRKERQHSSEEQRNRQPHQFKITRTYYWHTSPDFTRIIAVAHGKVLLCSVPVVAQWLCHVLACIYLYLNYRYTLWTLSCGLDGTCGYGNCVIGNHHILFLYFVDSEGILRQWHSFSTVLPERSTK